MAIATINPATGQTIKVFEPLKDSEIASKLDLAGQTFEQYRKTSFSERSQWLEKAAIILQQEKADFAKIMTLEMGKTYKAAIAEVEKCALVCNYYAEHAPSFLADVAIKTDASHSFVRYDPMGVILAVMPWNFPFWQVFRFAAPTLMAGNVGLLKHASNVPQCALAIADIIHRAGFPEGAFQTLLIGAAKVADIMADDRVKAATLTGSEPAGASLASVAGKQIKKTVLELGGSDPFIVLESADLETAVATATSARMLNNGQSCIAAKRFIIAEAIAPKFEKLLLDKFMALKVGDPMQPDTDLGPLATPDLLQDLHQQVQTAVKSGGKVLTGGDPLADRPGNFYPPTIITDIPLDSAIAQEEFFGPVALLFRVPDINAAIQLANATPFGLGASAWTNNDQERDRLITEIAAGAVFINSMVKSDPRLPFGGIKRSGYGRELSIQGIHEFVNLKTVWVQ
ncbi:MULTISPECIES: NAD-dependent succinate-semialdehyde dehydrogenase [Cyanophyceae]|mgnify:FL=1|jgi:succinate-semialdehyde dehydrogenase/glutarate-semialdehyde dehydrogenase|uniref:Succinate-semialdehyde dehydrogenase / glutarate-semialdehyde dehydrogenase n=2 Tax=Nodularia spumigena TaxID=70799 RepID=A0A2S0Q961_NODSP|nr:MULTISPECIES: NAD-dependent succinate-semialdehyde dehydrogenase [Cyanophyceae]MDB9358492.1 NAD-dependent succinate-semialdehyde dehydrogenase [Nodularia spumigena CS-587/03]AVZ30914.1 succinate-semialdehyde dehydrogenase / glutarate-semialdehyde dehydrogenase [Nodularia spumigena UHCC 0039]MDB9341158.1 NAD-dependent succinate-semialdehyde dehydrogenase [Nodularia spumigena CS-589/07]MDB9402349.1 NAD-dependent succinate-semialdehyde dehydrogenase [Microcystis aeruginosa CS-567/02-A1]MDB9499